MAEQEVEKPRPHFLDEEAPRQRARKSEKRVAADVGARLTPNSGANRIKGDLQSREITWEVKQTRARQYILKRSTLDKLVADAWGRVPALVVEFVDAKTQRQDAWAVVPLDWLRERV